MELHDDAHRLILTIVNYQFRHERALQNKWDANWLIVHGDVTTPEGHWQFNDPCLATWEVTRLADWLENIALQRDADNIDDFTEPNLRFFYHGETGGCFRIVVQFSHESLPRWVWSAGRGMARKYSVEFSVSSEQLQVAAVSLREELRRFPPRQATP